MPCGGKGRCGKCRVRVVSGKLAVTPADRNVFSDSQLREGWAAGLSGRNDGRNEDCRTPSRTAGIFSPGPSGRGGFGDDLLANHGCGIAVDIGTTTIAAASSTEGTAASWPRRRRAGRQRSFGADVISRIDAANKGKGKALQKAVRRDILADGKTL